MKKTAYSENPIEVTVKRSDPSDEFIYAHIWAMED